MRSRAKAALIATLTITLVILAVTLPPYITAQTTTTKLPVTAYSFTKPYDALVYLIGNEAVAIDKQGKIIAGPSTNHSYVIQKAIDYVNEGGKIYLIGKFNITSPIDVKKSVTIEGSGFGTELYSDIDGIVIMRIGEANATTKVADNIIIRNLKFNGMKKNVGGINIDAVDNVILENIMFVNCYARGLRATVWSDTEYHKHNFVAKNIININSSMVLGGIENGYIEALFTGVLPNISFGGTSWVDFSFGEWSNSIIRNVYFKGFFKDCDALYSGYSGLVVGLQNVDRSTINIEVENCKGWAIKYIDSVNKTNGYANKIIAKIKAGSLGPAGGVQIPYWWYGTQIDVVVNGTLAGAGLIDDGVGSIVKANIEGAYTAGVIIGSDARNGVYILNLRDNDKGGAGWPDLQVYGSAKLVIGSFSVTTKSIVIGINGVVERLIVKAEGSITINGKVGNQEGVSTISGNGTTTDFLLTQHKLINVTDPSKVLVKCTPASPDAINASPLVCYLSDEDNDGVYESIRVKFTSPPAIGTNNVKIVWEVEYVG